MNNIKALRNAMKLTQTELAKLCNVSQGSISGYESGRIEPDNEMLMKLAEVFGVSVDVILGREKPVHTNDARAPEQPREPNASTEPGVPRTSEARILSAGVDRMPAKDRERALRMVRLMFDQYEEYFSGGNDDDDTQL